MESTDNKTALVTGITGQDGAYLSKFLIGKGYTVYGLVGNTSTPNLTNLEYLDVADNLILKNANLLDLSSLIKYIEEIEPDEIYNLAAQSSVGISFEQPLWTLEFNILSTANLLEAVRIVKPNIRFYQASSSEMFGNVRKSDLPITEESVIHPASPYAISKASAHWTAVNYREAYGIFASCGILFNHESVLRGRSFVTKKIIETAVLISRGEEQQLILGNLDVKRDWGYAPEYVKVMWLMLQHERADDFVICSGEVHSLREFVQTVFDNLNLDLQTYLKIDDTLLRPLDLNIIYGDNSKAKVELGWEYEITFEELISNIINDQIKYFESKHSN